MVYTTIHELVEYILIEQSPLLHATIQAGSSIRNKARSHFRVHHFTFPPISSFLVSHFLFLRSWFYQCPKGSDHTSQLSRLRRESHVFVSNLTMSRPTYQVSRPDSLPAAIDIVYYLFPRIYDLCCCHLLGYQFH